MTGIYKITIVAPSGREQHFLIWWTTEAVCQDYCAKVRKRGLDIIIGQRMDSVSGQ